jgi:uncharacterized cupin superfamily protein
MTSGPRDIVNVGELPLKWLRNGTRFEVGLSDIDQVLGTTQIGATLHVVPAGKIAWPYHRHHGNDEFFFVLSGSGEYRVGDRRVPIRAGDCIGAPAGGDAHQIINSSDTELRYIAFANHGRADVIDYPDSGKIGIAIAHGNDRDPPSILDVKGRFTPADYWDGEDIGSEGETREGVSNG